MPEAQAIPAHGAPEFRAVEIKMFRRALRLGWSDLVSAPVYALVFAGATVLAGWVMIWIIQITGQSYWLVIAALGFPLVGPLAAVAFYEVSRRRELGQNLNWRDITAVVIQQSRRQLPSLCVIITVILLFWFFLAHMIFALFMGHVTMTNVSTSADVYLSAQGLKMLGFGSAVGLGFATLLYMVTMLSMPMLLDRDVDFMTATIKSFAYVQAYPIQMFGWAIFIAVLTFVALIPAFLGLLVVLPLLGHASWHLYQGLFNLTDFRPVAACDGCDGLRSCDEVVPGLAPRVENRVICVERPVCEPCLAEILPNVFGWIQLW